MLISVVIPVYNGAKTIGRLTDELVKYLPDNKLEIVLVNDGSEDNSHEVCLEIFKKYGDIVKYINLSKNFGEHNAVLAGLNYVTGDYAVIIDDDFQNPPEEVLKIVDIAVNGKHDVVYTYYDKKFHSLFRNIGSRFNNVVASYLLEKPKDLYLSSFKCLSRFVIQEIIKYKGPFPYIDGLILRTTRNIGKVLVRHDKRMEGKSSYTLRKLIRLWLNMFVNFSIVPLRISFFFGTILTFLGLFLIVYFLFDLYVLSTENAWSPGWASLIISVIIFSGTQLLSLGLLGEYIGKSYLTENKTPQFVIREYHCEK